MNLAKPLRIIGEQRESYNWKKSLSLLILMNLCYNPMVVAKGRYIVSMVAAYSTDLEVQIYFHS